MDDIFSTDTSLDILRNATPSSFIENSHDNITKRIEVRIFLFISLLSVGLSFLTNTFTIYTLHTMDSLHKTESLLYKALAINDIIIVLCEMALVVSLSLEIDRGCFQVFLSSLFVVYVSVIIIVLINVNRFIMIMRPLRHQRLVTPKRLYCVLLVGMSSTVALLVVINILGSTSLIREDVCPGLTPQNNISDSALNLLVVLPILLGFAVILITSSGIFYKSRQQATKIAQMRRIILQQRAQPEVNNRPGNHRAVTASGLKGLRTVGVITISYWFIWLPYVIYVSTIGGLYRFEWFKNINLFLQFCNCIWNPLILSIAYKPFRIASKNIILKMKASCCGSNIIH